MKRLGEQTWKFESRPRIAGSATVVGPDEGEGPLAADFSHVYDNLEIDEKTWEKAERRLLEQASQLALVNSNLTKDDIQFFVGGDLLNQIISSSFAARKLGIPYLGVFGACSTSMESLALASLIVDSGAQIMPSRVLPVTTVRQKSNSAILRNTVLRSRQPHNIPLLGQAVPSLVPPAMVQLLTVRP